MQAFRGKMLRKYNHIVTWNTFKESYNKDFCMLKAYTYNYIEGCQDVREQPISSVAPRFPYLGTSGPSWQTGCWQTP